MTWERGDLAYCVANTQWATLVDDQVVKVGGPQKGDYCFVESITLNEKLQEALVLREWPGMDTGYSSYKFRKVPPLTRRERDEFLTDLDFEQDVLALRFQYEKGVA